MDNHDEDKKGPKFLDIIQELRKRDPFIPFRIVMSSGEKYVVDNPDAMAFGETQLFYCFPKSDRVAWLRFNQIESVETMEWKAAV